MNTSLLISKGIILADLRRFVNRTRDYRLNRQLNVLADYMGVSNNSTVPAIQFEDIISEFLRDLLDDRSFKELNALRHIILTRKYHTKATYHQALSRAFRRWVSEELRAHRNHNKHQITFQEEYNMRLEDLLDNGEAERLEHLLDTVSRVAVVPLARDMVSWRMGLLTSDFLCQKYGISRKTLTNRWNEFKDLVHHNMENE